MIDIWGHGSDGLLVNLVYNTHYGMGYHINQNRILVWDEFIFYSSSTVAIWVYTWIRQNMWIGSHEFRMMQLNTTE
jgi:hypothetical protein